jgi:hypothetical protein
MKGEMGVKVGATGGAIWLPADLRQARQIRMVPETTSQEV